MRRLALASLALLPLLAQAQSLDPRLVSGLQWRLVGPYRGGRSIACTGVPGHPSDFYFGACGGGLWKTSDAGETWKCVTDGFLGSSSVGAVAVSPSNPDVVYIGTGEKDIRGNISEGDGAYKSTDAGKTWKRVGLEATRTISRIVVHPKNPDTVWVAALGHVYGPNRDRGVFKSTDGGATWRQVLYQSDRAGAIDLAIDPKNPDVLYAATWEAWRTPYFLNSGGAGSKLWKSVDGGEHWADLTAAPGLPKTVIGKIGLAVSPADPQRLWAMVEAELGGLFHSEDGGGTWKLVNDDREFRQRAWYFSRVVPDPVQKDTVWVLNTGLFKSTNAGKTFEQIGSRHGDEHDLWIDPSDTKRMVNSDDGGATVSLDGGRHWSEQDIPTAQFYHVSTDTATPYHILGAQQDNSTVRIASRGGARGIGPSDWSGTAGGESGFVVAKRDDPDVVYGGNYGGEIGMLNHRTGAFRDISPWPDNPMGHGAIDLKYRFQWTFPIATSPHDPRVLYATSQVVHRSADGGTTWSVVSPDLTRSDPKTLQSSGGPITQDNTSVEYYATIFTFAESPRQRGVLWAGSDDGLVHVSQDSGKTWSDVTPREMPHWGLCSMIDPSPHVAGRAFLAVDNHENDDCAPYAYRTDDFGRTWKSISRGLPSNSFVRVVREDPVRKNMLYCGTETGLFVSFNEGDDWTPLQNNLPLCPIHDLTVKDDDLIVATHGRSFWSLDNLASLRQMPDAHTSEPVLFRPKDAVKPAGRGFGFGGGTQSPNTEYAQNPPSGVVVDYWLPGKADPIKLEVLDKDGLVVGTGSSGGEAGFHRATVRSLSYPGYKSFPGMVLWSGRGGSVPCPPGVYTVRLSVGQKALTQPVRWSKNPVTEASDADLVEQARFAKEVAARETEANDAVAKIRDIRKKADEAVKAKPEIKPDRDALMAKLDPIEEAIYQTKSKSGEDPLNFPIRLNDKIAGVLGTVLSGDARPTRQSYEVFAELSRQLKVQLDVLQAVLDRDLAQFNVRLKAAGLAEIRPQGL